MGYYSQLDIELKEDFLQSDNNGPITIISEDKKTKKALYRYEGSIYEREHKLETFYVDFTRAFSPKEAMRKISYKYKKKRNLSIKTNLTFPGTLEKV